MYECKNLVKTKAGDIDLELNHPAFGWIPFTASARDCEPHGVEIYNRASRGDYGPVKEASE